MNRQSRRHPSSSFLPAFYPSKSRIIATNEKRKNVSMNASCSKKRKAERGK